MDHAFALGLDFGTESLRVVVVRTMDGRIAGEASTSYPNGVWDERFPPTGERLPADFALQVPEDYLATMKQTIPAALQSAGVDADRIIGLGIDFTACTPLPVKKDGSPLCRSPEFSNEPHAYVKLWKHHGAIPEANRINSLATERNEAFLARYGGTTSSEWLIAKLLETMRQAPPVYAAADRFMEASDWVVQQLTGMESRGACAAGYKGMWHEQAGYPSDEFLEGLEPGFSKAKHLLGRKFSPAGKCAGPLTEEAARSYGLPPGLPVSNAIIDAHAAVPGCGVGEAGKMVIILGTSSCHMLMHSEQVLVEGIQGVVWEGILPGYYGYEAGQAATGDLFAWFGRTLSSEDDREKMLAALQEKAAAMKPGEAGMIALDWWNGNRSILINPELSGLLLGMTLNTRPEEIFRTLLEATGFGTRMIIENFTRHGIPVDEVIVCGGMAEKNPLLLQIYADITGRPLARAAAAQTCALGAAIFGAAAAGSANGGYDSVQDAVAAMAPEPSEIFTPQPDAVAAYDRVFALYKEVHDQFGRGEKRIMERLRALRHTAEVK